MENELVTVATASNIIEAGLLRNQIEEEGIEVFLTDDNIVGTYGLLANAVGGIKIKVNSEDAEDALAILEEARAANASVDENKNEDTGWGECPKCHSKNVKPYRAMVGFKGILMFLGFPVAKPQRLLVCNNCQNEWGDF
jgi:hypothetical protein